MPGKEELYAAILGIERPWQVEGVEFEREAEEVRVLIRVTRGTRL